MNPHTNFVVNKLKNFSDVTVGWDNTTRARANAKISWVIQVLYLYTSAIKQI